MTTKTLSPTIPSELMRKSPRPGASMTLRLGLAGGFALAGLIAPTPVIKGVCLGLSVLSFVVVPFLGDRLLRPIEAEVEKANRSDARKLLRDLTERWAVRWFAPSAWVAVQQARLQLSSGDPRAAAMSYFEARRASALGGQRPELASAEADAHLHADDRKQALKLLRELEDKKSLGALDHLNFGVALLSESGQSKAALEHFEAAYKTLGKEPRVVAGLALARQRCGDLDGARELLDGELDLEGSEDRTARDLAKRARKGVRAKGDGDKKRKGKRKKGKDKKSKAKSEPEAKQAREASPSEETAAPAKSRKDTKSPKDAKKKDKKKKKDKPKGKKARRAARREARKQREAEERAARAAQREREELEAADARREASERAAAKAKRASEVRTLPAVPGLEGASKPAAKPLFTPKPPAAASGSIGGPKPAAPAAPVTAPPKNPAPPKADSLFGGMFAPPKTDTKPAPLGFAKPAVPVAKPATPSAKPAAPAAKPAAPVAAPSLDDLFAPVKPAGSSGAPTIPAPPKIGAPPVVPPPPISAPAAGKPPAVAPPKFEDWGSGLDVQVPPPVVPPMPSKPKSEDD